VPRSCAPDIDSTAGGPDKRKGLPGTSKILRRDKEKATAAAATSVSMRPKFVSAADWRKLICILVGVMMIALAITWSLGGSRPEDGGRKK
jgi:hypothetical protein